MLRLDTDHTTRHALTLAPTFWRWANLTVDVPAARGSLTLCCYPTLAAARSPAGKLPLDRRVYQVTGEAFVLLATALDGPDPEPISAVIYSHVRTVDPLFTAAVDVE